MFDTTLKLLISLIKTVLFVLCNPLILILVIVIILVFYRKNKKYKSSDYYKITKLPYNSVKNDVGKYGEYLIYIHLKHYESLGAKFLFNVYVPKENGETSEIDVLMISPKGLFVFESKNYSGWIFGKEEQKNWYQTLRRGRYDSQKEVFYNPIMQNKTHLKYLKAFLNVEVPMHSIIVFSERCTLMNVQIKSENINVINRNEVCDVVSTVWSQIPDTLLSEEKIEIIYNKLYPLTQVDDNTKEQHINNIQNNLQKQEDSIAPLKVVEESNIEESSSTNELVENNLQNETIKQETTDNTNDTKVEELKCPKCNGNLVLRTATRGANIGKQFYGCENYPKCKFIRNIK